MKHLFTQKTSQEEADYFYRVIANPDEPGAPSGLDTVTRHVIEQMAAFEQTAGEVSPGKLEVSQKRVWQQLAARFEIEEYAEDVQPGPVTSKRKPVQAGPVKSYKMPLDRNRSWPRAVVGGMALVTLLAIAGLVLLTLVSVKGPNPNVPISNIGSGTGLNPVPEASPTATSKQGLPWQVITPATSPTAAPVTASPAANITPRQNGYTSIPLSGHTGPVNQLVWSPDGKYFASSSDSDPVVRVWKLGDTLQQTTLLTTLQGHLGGLLSLAWSPDGKTLASGSADRTVKIWNVPAGTLLKTLEAADAGTVQALAFAPDGKTLAAAYQRYPLNVLINLWRTADWTAAKTLDTGTNFFQAYNLKWSPDGAFLAGGMTLYKLWRADGTEVGTAYNGGAPAWGLAWSPDSKRWAVASESSVIYFYDTTAKELGYLNAGNGDFLAWSPDGKLLASGQYGVTLTNTENQTFSSADILINSRGPDGSVMTLAWSPDGKRLATGAARNFEAAASANDNSLTLWDNQGRLTDVLNGHTGQINVVAWSPDGKTLASGSEDKTVRVWALKP